MRNMLYVMTIIGKLKFDCVNATSFAYQSKPPSLP